MLRAEAGPTDLEAHPHPYLQKNDIPPLLLLLKLGAL